MENDFIIGNDGECFAKGVEEKLGSYVYALCDPRDKKVFYVGKAGGKSSQGNERIFNHFEHAKKALNSGFGETDAKTRRIIEIWLSDEKVEWYIIRHGLEDESVALHVEAALIDLLGISQNGPALNLVKGHGAQNHGLLNQESIKEYGAEPVPSDFKCDVVFIFPIQNALARDESPYEATRKAWAVSGNLQASKNAIAVGVANGVSKGAYRIASWKESEIPEIARDPNSSAKKKGSRLYEFDKSEDVDELTGKNFSGIISSAIGYWQRGNYLVISLNGDGKFSFVRGWRDKQTLLCL